MIITIHSAIVLLRLIDQLTDCNNQTHGQRDNEAANVLTLMAS